MDVVRRFRSDSSAQSRSSWALPPATLVTDGMTLRSFVPLVGMLLGLVAIEQVRRKQERGL